MVQPLPSKYYHDHGLELFGYIRDHCYHLLEEQHVSYIETFFRLGSETQCLLIRIIARKPSFIKRDSLAYPEIAELNICLKQLTQQGLINLVRPEDWHDLVPVLTKSQLLSCFNYTSLTIPKNTKKEILVSKARNYFAGNESCLYVLRENYFIRLHQTTIDYFLFLFFGDLRSRFDKFVMRDLGVMRTRKNRKNIVARFKTLDEAKSAFQFSLIKRDMPSKNSDELQRIAESLLQDKPIGEQANSLKQKLLLAMGLEVSVDNTSLALRLWKACNLPKALEHWVRFEHKHGDRTQLKKRLEKMQGSSLPAEQQIFVDDFYARKYQGKRTSIYTDMLREESIVIDLDEAYLNHVEQGVISYQEAKGFKSYFSENNFWRCLFALCFWDLLYHHETHNEFDYLPAALAKPEFYELNENSIEKALRIFDEPKRTQSKFLKLMIQHYGTATGVFNWKPVLADQIKVFLQSTEPDPTKQFLRYMAQGYANRNDGFPDLMYLEGQTLKFAEVKAPGDSLRDNQLVRLKQLRQCGFDVNLIKVNWRTDPKQVYAVVDIETTGTKPSLNAITEVAIVKVCGGKIVDRWSTLINPQALIPRHITHLTNITNEMVKSAPIFSEVADEILSRLRGCIFVAHNVGFDYGFLKLAFEQLGHDFRFPKYCTVRNSRKAFPRLNSYALGSLTSYLDIDLEQAHRALDDAAATAELLILIQEKNALSKSCSEQ